MSGQLDGRAGIITGAAGGIGRSLAGAFAAEGARVAILDVDGDGAAAAAAELGGLGFGVDITDAAAVEAAVAEIERSFGELRLPGQQRRHPPSGRASSSTGSTSGGGRWTST